MSTISSFAVIHGIKALFNDSLAQINSNVMDDGLRSGLKHYGPLKQEQVREYLGILTGDEPAGSWHRGYALGVLVHQLLWDGGATSEQNFTGKAESKTDGSEDDR